MTVIEKYKDYYAAYMKAKEAGHPWGGLNVSERGVCHHCKALAPNHPLVYCSTCPGKYTIVKMNSIEFVETFSDYKYVGFYDQLENPKNRICK